MMTVLKSSEDHMFIFATRQHIFLFSVHYDRDMTLSYKQRLAATMKADFT